MQRLPKQYNRQFQKACDTKKAIFLMEVTNW